MCMSLVLCDECDIQEAPSECSVHDWKAFLSVPSRNFIQSFDFHQNIGLLYINKWLAIKIIINMFKYIRQPMLTSVI